MVFKLSTLLALNSILASCAFAQSNEKLIDTKTYVKDGKTITERTYKADSVGSYVPPKSHEVKKLSGDALKALQKKCDEAKLKAKSDPSVKSFQYGSYSYDLNCNLLGKYEPPQEKLRKEIVEESVPKKTEPDVTLPPEPKVGFDGHSMELHKVMMNGRTIKVDKLDFDRWNATKDKQKKDLFLEFAKKYKK